MKAQWASSISVQNAEPVVAIVQARMTSTRFPGKVLKPLAGRPLIVRVAERVLRIPGVQQVVIALAEGPANSPVLAALEGMPVGVVRGSEQDVLARTATAARAHNAATVMRITSDCPLLDPAMSASVLSAYLAARDSGIRYARTAFHTGFPHGFDTEVFPVEALYEADREATDPYEREHVTPYLWRHPERYSSIILDARPDRRHWRLVVDTEEDYRLAATIYETLYPQKRDFGYMDLCRFLQARPELLEINAHIARHAYVGLR